MKVHEWTGPTGVKFRDVAEPSGTYYHDTTPRPVIDLLEAAAKNGASVRLFYGDRETGKDWMEERDVFGTIGRSMGPIKIPLIIANGRSSGGPGILCDCIVRMLVNGVERYRHPNYKEPDFSISEIPAGAKCGNVDLRKDGYTHTTKANGANFKSLEKAQRHVAFMTGKRMRP